MAKPHRRGKAETQPDQKQQFLDAMARGLTITEACAEAVMGRSTAYDLRKTDKAFAEAWDDAYEAGTDTLRAEVRKRAMAKDKPSDILLMFELKRRDPSYRESFKHEHGGPNGGPIPVQMIELVPVQPK